MKKIGLLSTLLVAGLLLTGCNKTCTDDCLPEDWEKNNQIQCGNVYDPICGEDGKVYSNGCYLNVAGAHWDETLGVKNDECFKITKESLYGKYILTRYNDNHNVRDNHNIELNISADGIFAKFCNHLGTSNYSLSGNILTVEEMSQTEMACEGENGEWLMNAEREFNLNDARVTLSEDNLTISTSRGAQYQFQISDDYNQFLEAIKSSGEQPQGKNNLIIPAFDDINKVVDKCGDDSYDYNVYQKAYILPYKDGYIGYQLGGQDGWELYLTYRKLGEPCNIISQSDNIFWWNPYYKEGQETFRGASYPDNKIYIAQGLFSGVPTEEIVKELNCIPGNNFEDHDHTCMKEAEKYFYDLIVGNEENEYFTQWMNKLKEDIDNEDYKTFSYYRVEYDTCSQKVVDLIGALQPNQDEKARGEYQVKRTENMHKCVLENLNK